MRAGIDIGSNTFRLIIADLSNGNLRVVEKKMVTVRLAQGVDATGRLSGEAVDRGLRALLGFKNILDRYSVESLCACGTEALRVASNSGDFLVRASAVLGSPVEILDGRQEALLTLAGVQGDLHVTGPFLLVDAGGGSTECIYSAGETILKGIASLSIGIGAVSLTETFLHNVLPEDHEVGVLEREIRARLIVALKGVYPTGSEPITIIGCGGTITALAALDLGLSCYDGARVHGYHLTAKAIGNLWCRLAALSVAERNSIPGLQEGRGEIILAGLKIYQVLLEVVKAEEILVSDAGLLEGLISLRA